MANEGRHAVSDSAEFENINVFLWSDESYQIGITKYEGIVPNATVP